jgi:gas vesicle protein
MFKFLFGLGIGIGLGMVFAPASGEETRNMIAENLSDMAEAPRRKIGEALDDIRQQAGEMGKGVRQNLGESAVEAVRPDFASRRTA